MISMNRSMNRSPMRSGFCAELATMARAAMNWTNVTASAPKNPYAALLEHYLSPRHRDDPGHGCAFAALSGEAARCGKPVRSAFASGPCPMKSLTQPNRSF